jgi:hypothetical protein
MTWDGLPPKFDGPIVVEVPAKFLLLFLFIVIVGLVRGAIDLMIAAWKASPVDFLNNSSFVIGVPISVLFIGGLAFLLRKSKPILYGVIELGAAIGTAMEALQQASRAEPFHFVLVYMGCIYLAVQGFIDMGGERKLRELSARNTAKPKK